MWQNALLLAFATGCLVTWATISFASRWDTRPQWLSWLTPMPMSSNPTESLSPSISLFPKSNDLLQRADALLRHPSSSHNFAPHWNEAISLLSDVEHLLPELATIARDAREALGAHALHPTTTNQHIRPVRDALSRAVLGDPPQLRRWLLTGAWRLCHNVRDGNFKDISFLDNGQVGKNRNKFESQWELIGPMLVIRQEEGSVHNRFLWNSINKRFESTNELESVAPGPHQRTGQYIELLNLETA